MNVLIQGAYFVLGLSLLVGVHELGHLLAAKWFGMRVEKFSIGFPPKIFGFTWRGTEYSIGAIPLGGFVKISGMVDESMDKEQMKLPPQPWEFRSKPAWQRLIVMLGGITVNVASGILIFSLVTYYYGSGYLPAREARYGVVASPVAQKIGLRTGDKILNINGKTFERFEDLSSPEVLLGTNVYYTVERNGRVLNVPIPNNYIDLIAGGKSQQSPIEPIAPFKVGEVDKKSPGGQAGLKEGDKIVSINGKPVPFFHELQAALAASKNKQIEVAVLRGGQPVTFKAAIGNDGILGFAPEAELKYEKTYFSLGKSFAIGTERAMSVIWLNVKGFGKIFDGSASLRNSLSGPVAIFKMFPKQSNWEGFWSLCGLLSMILAFMNLLPIPALDGGHVMFLSYEIVAGRKLSDKFLENAQKVGMVLLLSLMAFAVFNDVFKSIM